MIRIPVYAGSRIIAFCDSVSVRRYLDAANAEVVRKRKTNQIVQVNLASYGDDSMRRSTGASPCPTYDEQLEVHTLVTLKRYDKWSGQLVRWGDDDGFNPRRFNPDRVQVMRNPDASEREPVVEIVATPAGAPHVPPARFCVKRDPSLPWSKENSREIF